MFDNYAQKDLIEKNLKELKKLNPNIKDEISKNTTVKLPKPYSEKPLEVNKNILTGLEKYKKDGIELNENQINLRNEIFNKKSITLSNDTSLNDLAYALSDTYKPLNITVLRNNKEITIKNIKIEKEGLLGILLKIEDVYAPTKTPKDIVFKSFDYIYTTTATMLFSLWQLITGKVSASDMHGVIAVVKVGGDIIEQNGFFSESVCHSQFLFATPANRRSVLPRKKKKQFQTNAYPTHEGKVYTRYKSASSYVCNSLDNTPCPPDSWGKTP